MARRSAPLSRACKASAIFSAISFDRENIVQFAIVSLRPKMRVVLGIDELDMDTHPIACFAHRDFENVGHAKLSSDFRNVFRGTLESLGRGARDDLEIADPREPGQDFLLNSISKVNVRFIL